MKHIKSTNPARIICEYCSTDHSTTDQDQACLGELFKRSQYVEYRYFFRDQSHPLARTNISVRRSGLVDLAQHLVSVRRGLWIRPGEIVHFSDDNVKNFSPDNLQVVTRSQLSKSVAGQRSTEKICAICGTAFPISRSHLDRRETCSNECRAIWQKRFIVTADELLLLVWEHSTVEVAEMFGVSDKAIQKRCDKLGLPKPPRGYWALLKASNVTVEHNAALIRLGWTQEEIDALDRRIMEAENRKSLDGIPEKGDIS